MTLPLSIITLHFIGDWLLQSNWMALNKSRNTLALVTHVLVMSCAMLIGMAAIGYDDRLAFTFISFNALAHYATDAITSQITSELWFMVPALSPNGKPNGLFTYDTGNKRYWFFITIGADQLIHYATLAYLFEVVFK
jgi:hypothetical protein